MPIIALLVVMLGFVVLLNVLRPADRTTLQASGDQATILGFAAPDTDSSEAPGEQSPNGADDAAASATDDPAEATPTPEPTATAIPTTPPVTVPALAPAVPDAAPADDDAATRGERTEAADLVIPTSTATPVPPTATPVPPTATPLPAATATAIPEPTATPIPQPTATPIPEPTATPLPAPTATPIPEPTATPIPEPTATPTPLPAAPQPGAGAGVAAMEAFVFEAVNQVRARAGLPSLAPSSEMNFIARDWSGQMAAAGFISHRPQAQLSAMLPAGWWGWAENVAEAPTVEWAQSALEQSPGHYANMTGDYTHLGVGVVTAANGQVFVTHVFAKY